MALCRNCGEVLPEDAQYCPKCGTPTTLREQPPAVSPVADTSGTNEPLWYVHQNGRREGPYTHRKLVELVTQRKVTENAHVWRPGMREWTQITQISPFKEAFKSTRVPSKNPRTAAIIAAVVGLLAILGAGHFYVRKKRAVLVGAGFMVLGLLFAIPATLAITGVQNSYGKSDLGAYAMFEVIYLSLWVWQIFDARRWAKKVS